MTVTLSLLQELYYTDIVKVDLDFSRRLTIVTVLVVEGLERQYNARKGFHNATGGNVTQTEWSDDRP